MVVRMKITALWNTDPCSLVEVDQLTLVMEAVHPSEMSVNFKTT
jgi:hypothetical protein